MLIAAFADYDFIQLAYKEAKKKKDQEEKEELRKRRELEKKNSTYGDDVEDTSLSKEIDDTIEEYEDSEDELNVSIAIMEQELTPQILEIFKKL